jgi:hypothetical protein
MVTKERIESYLSVLNEMKYFADRGKKMDTKAITSKYGVGHGISASVQRLGWFTKKGVGLWICNRKDQFQPIDARTIIELPQKAMKKYLDINAENGNDELFNIQNTKEIVCVEKKSIYKKIPPSIEEIAGRMKQKGITKFTAEYFWHFYNAIEWKIGSHKMKNWDAALSMWNARTYVPKPTQPQQLAINLPSKTIFEKLNEIAEECKLNGYTLTVSSGGELTLKR